MTVKNTWDFPEPRCAHCKILISAQSEKGQNGNVVQYAYPLTLDDFITGTYLLCFACGISVEQNNQLMLIWLMDSSLDKAETIVRDGVTWKLVDGNYMVQPGIKVSFRVPGYEQLVGYASAPNDVSDEFRAY